MGSHTNKRPLDYIHADLWGHEDQPIFGGNKYFLFLVDDYSRKVWVYHLKAKSDTFHKFWTWLKIVENQLNKKLKTLRTDNGLEFCNAKFDKFCKQKGIMRQRTIKYSPQQSGVAEKMSKTLVDKVRDMLVSSGLARGFWAEALCMTSYLMNRSPYSSVELKTPQELWTGKPSDLTYVREFGCVAYVHQIEGRLVPRDIRCVMLGYPKGVSGYRLWVLGEPGFKIINSNDVVFNESVMPCLKSKFDDSNEKFQNEMKLAKNDFTHFDGNEPVMYEVGVPHGETEMESNTPVFEENSILDYQLARDSERWQIKNWCLVSLPNGQRMQCKLIYKQKEVFD